MENDNGKRWSPSSIVAATALVVTIVGNVYMYVAHEMASRELEIRQGKADLAFQEGATRLNDAEQVFKQAEAKRSEANTLLAEAQAQRIKEESGPRIILTTEINPSYGNESLQQIDVRLVIQNVGTAPASISAASLDVFHGTLSQEATELVARANALHALEQMSSWDISGINLSDIISYSDEDRRIQERYDELHKDCPHGRLFFVDYDCTWKQMESLRRKSTSYVLLPEQTVQVNFVILCTHFYNHPIWVRLHPALIVDAKNHYFGEHIVSFKESQYNCQDLQYGNVSKVPELRTRYEGMQYPSLPTTSPSVPVTEDPR